MTAVDPLVVLADPAMVDAATEAVREELGGASLNTYAMRRVARAVLAVVAARLPATAAPEHDLRDARCTARNPVGHVPEYVAPVASAWCPVCRPVIGATTPESVAPDGDDEAEDPVSTALAEHRFGIHGTDCDAPGCDWAPNRNTSDWHRQHVQHQAAVLAALGRRGDPDVARAGGLGEVARRAAGVSADSPLPWDEVAAAVLADAGQDAPDVWDGTVPPGGNVCSACGMPVESEPCRQHQPHAWDRCVNGDPDAASCPTCVREGGPYRCCPHCADDPVAHEDGQRNHHDLPCSTCIVHGDPDAAPVDAEAIREAVTAWDWAELLAEGGPDAVQETAEQVLTELAGRLPRPDAAHRARREALEEAARLVQGDSDLPLLAMIADGIRRLAAAPPAVAACTSLGCPNPGTVPGVYGDEEERTSVTFCASCAAGLTRATEFTPDEPAVAAQGQGS